MYCGWWFNSLGKFLFLVLWNVWTLTTYEFIYMMNSVWIHIFFALQMYEFIQIWIHIMYEFIYFFYEFIYFLQCKIKAASARKPRACSTSAQRELQARSASCECGVQAARAKPELTSCPDQAAPGCPWPLGLRAAAPIVRVHTAAPIVRVACGCPDS